MEKRTGIIDHPTLEELECLILCPKGSKGYNAEAIVLQQMFGFGLVHGFGRIHQMVDGMYDIWLHPDHLVDYQRAQQEHLADIEQGIKIYNDDLPVPSPIESRFTVSFSDESRRIRAETEAMRKANQTQAEHNQQQALHNLSQNVDNQGQAIDNQGQAIDNQGQARDNKETRDANQKRHQGPQDKK